MVVRGWLKKLGDVALQLSYQHAEEGFGPSKGGAGGREEHQPLYHLQAAVCQSMPQVYDLTTAIAYLGWQLEEVKAHQIDPPLPLN